MTHPEGLKGITCPCCKAEFILPISTQASTQITGVEQNTQLSMEETCTPKKPSRSSARVAELTLLSLQLRKPK